MRAVWVTKYLRELCMRRRTLAPKLSPSRNEPQNEAVRASTVMKSKTDREHYSVRFRFLLRRKMSCAHSRNEPRTTHAEERNNFSQGSIPWWWWLKGLGRGARHDADQPVIILTRRHQRRAAEPCPTVMGPPASCKRDGGRWLPPPQAQSVLLLARRSRVRALRRRGCGRTSALLRQARSPLPVPPRPATGHRRAPRPPAHRARGAHCICSVFLSVNTHSIV